ncbi:MAG: DUF116 domain-containing protein [Victivallales bacterium]|nr:DUF116 domain-containing protein [Victivallales bacterium]
MGEIPAEMFADAEVSDMLRIPASKHEREIIRAIVRGHLAGHAYTPPLTMEEISSVAENILLDSQIDARYLGFVSVLVSNELWIPTVSSVPFERRVLMLPQCLRSSEGCPGEMDEYGLLCEQCGRCAIGRMQEEAEKLGYVVLVAEGTTVVTKLIDSGKIDAVVGVSCLSVLEKTFEHMSFGAVPGIAIPLISDGCRDTSVDEDWVLEYVRLKSGMEDAQVFLDISSLYDEVKSWFTYDALTKDFGVGEEVSERMAVGCLAGSGKRWRPFLAAGVFASLDDAGSGLGAVRKVALAVECFHKASLIHDDIEDGDILRDGAESLHALHGVPVALNIGDLLIGEGYRMIGESSANPAVMARMLQVASEGHRTLCLGQGEELFLRRRGKGVGSAKQIEIFKLKTSPAFGVALQLGALCQGATDDVCDALRCFSDFLGIAYQIKDDLDDYSLSLEERDPSLLHCSLLPELAFEAAAGRKARSTDTTLGSDASILSLIAEMRADEKARMLCEHHKNQALRSLSSLRNTRLKSFLQRVVGKILGETKI